MVEDLLKEAALREWKYVRTAKNIKVYKAKTEKSSLMVFKFEGTLNIPWKTVYEFVRIPKNLDIAWYGPSYLGPLEMITEKENFKEYPKDCKIIPVAIYDCIGDSVAPL
jgi:hypothetical protein